MSLDAQILKQIEFYFSDSNFRRDKFLRTKAAENPHGSVLISVLLTFNQLKSLTTDASVVVQALSSASSDIVELNEAKDGIQRKSCLPENDDSPQRTIIIGGLGRTQPERQDLVALFPDQVVQMVRFMTKKKQGDKIFDGHAQVEFASTSQMAVVLDTAQANPVAYCLDTKILKICPVSTFYALSREQKQHVQRGCSPVPTTYLKIDHIAQTDDTIKFRVFVDLIEQRCLACKIERPYISSHDAPSEALNLIYLSFEHPTMAATLLADVTKTPLEHLSKTYLVENVPADELPKISKASGNTRGAAAVPVYIQFSNISEGLSREDVIEHLKAFFAIKKSTRVPMLKFKRGDTQGSMKIDRRELALEFLAFVKENPVILKEGESPVVFTALDEAPDVTKIDYTSGMVLYCKGFAPECRRETIREIIDALVSPKQEPEEEQASSIVFIDYEQGQAAGHVRFNSTEAAGQMHKLAQTEAGLVIGSKKLDDVTILTGEDEEAYYRKIQQTKEEKFAKKRAFRQTENRKFNSHHSKRRRH